MIQHYVGLTIEFRMPHTYPMTNRQRNRRDLRNDAFGVSVETGRQKCRPCFLILNSVRKAVLFGKSYNPCLTDSAPPLLRGIPPRKEISFWILHAGAVVFRLPTFLAFHPHLALFSAVAEMVRVVMRGCRRTFRTLEPLAFAVTARAMA